MRFITINKDTNPNAILAALEETANTKKDTGPDGSNVIADHFNLPGPNDICVTPVKKNKLLECEKTNIGYTWTIKIKNSKMLLLNLLWAAHAYGPPRPTILPVQVNDEGIKQDTLIKMELPSGKSVYLLHGITPRQMQLLALSPEKHYHLKLMLSDKAEERAAMFNINKIADDYPHRFTSPEKAKKTHQEKIDEGRQAAEELIATGTQEAAKLFDAGRSLLTTVIETVQCVDPKKNADTLVDAVKKQAERLKINIKTPKDKKDDDKGIRPANTGILG